MVGDARLVRLASRGDEAAFAAIFRRYHQPLYRYCRSITGDPEDASDALQNTMVRAMGALRGERRAVELKPWLFRVAHNESISLLRRRRPGGASEGEEGAVDGPEVGLAAREELRDLMSDLRELPERQRAVVVLRELNGLSYAEIASVFKTSTAAAKQAAYDGRVALQDLARGRAMDCEAVTRAISDGDLKFLGGRKLRGHLRACAECSQFKQALEARSTRLCALAPALPATVAAAMMEKLFAGGSTGGTSVGLSAAGAKVMAGAGAVKGATAVVAAVTVAAGALAGGAQLARDDRVAKPAGERSDQGAVHGDASRQGEPGRAARQVREAGGSSDSPLARDDAVGNAQGRAEPAAAPLGPDGDPYPGGVRPEPLVGAGPAPRPPSVERRPEPASDPVADGDRGALRPERPPAPVTPQAGAPTVPDSPTRTDPPAPPSEPRTETPVAPSQPTDRPGRTD